MTLEALRAALKAADELEKLAKAATPGPWFNRGEISSEIVDSDRKPIADACCSKTGPDGDLQDEANGLFIAAANPTAILSLIADLRRAAEAYAALEAASTDGEFVRVPREPTEAMIEAAISPKSPMSEWLSDFRRQEYARLYRTMLAAAPTYLETKP